jgi:hypothetical protein
VQFFFSKVEIKQTYPSSIYKKKGPDGTGVHLRSVRRLSIDLAEHPFDSGSGHERQAKIFFSGNPNFSHSYYPSSIIKNKT